MRGRRRVGRRSSSSSRPGRCSSTSAIPAGNLIELNWADASTLDRSRYPELRVLAEHIPQTPESERAVLYLDRSLV